MGSLYASLAFTVSGILTYLFHSFSARLLGPEEYGGLAILWSATFLTVQVLWIGVSQTIGRYVAEREARGLDWRPVISSVKRLQAAILLIFLLVCALGSSLLAEGIFGGDWLLAAAFVAAVAVYAPEYFMRGVFSGRRQLPRLGALHLVESFSRALIAIALLVTGAGVMGAAAAVVLAPLIGVLLIRSTPGKPPEKPGDPFGLGEALRFSGPVFACMAFSQVLMNGGPVMVVLLGGTREQAGLLLAALILARAPQYVLTPSISALLPYMSRVLATERLRGLDRFVGRALAAVVGLGVLLLGGVWLLGEFGMKVLYGAGFEVSRGVLMALALLTAFYLVCEVLNQALFARGLGRLAVYGWGAGLLVSAMSVAFLGTAVLERVSYSLALGAAVAAGAQALLYLANRRLFH